MSDFPIDFVDATRPLRAEEFDEKGAAAISKLADRGYEVHVGLTQEIAEQIVQMALEPNIREYCPNDCSQRFKDMAAIAQWLTKRRAVFVLLQRDNNDKLTLAGYGWAGDGTSPHVSGGETTFAIRIGEIGQGQGLASSYAWLIVAGSAALYHAKDFWLETWGSNAGAVHTYHKIGFKDVAHEAAQRPTSAGGLVDDTRVYMSLDNELLA